MPDDLTRELVELRKFMSELRKWAYGNGHPDDGISYRVAALERSFSSMNDAMTTLAGAEKKRQENEDAIKNQLKGARMAILGFAALFGVSGIAGWAWLLNLLQRILAQIPAS